MANGAPRHSQTGPKPTKEQEEAARALLEAAAQQPAFFELLEVRQFNATLLQIGEDNFALCFDTPAGRRYGFPMTRPMLDKMSEMFTKVRLGIPQGGGLAMPREAG